MDKVNYIEQHFGVRFPDEYREFLVNASSFVLQNPFYCVILQDGYRTDGRVDEFYTLENFIERQKYREELIDFQTHFENPTTYVEAEYLYFIAEGSGAICIALGGKHYGKIYSVDNGDFGIIYQADNINIFIDSMYEPSKYRCTSEELIEAVEHNNVALLAELIENRDGDKQIEHSSFLDIKLFKIAYQHGLNNILRYLMSKGYKGHTWADYYNLKFDTL